ncbi:ABC transporter ATP-binding protein [Floricoccus tropicus]|nr:ABC transporter ATP-binding protein [Floricoccus tropicus]
MIKNLLIMSLLLIIMYINNNVSVVYDDYFSAIIDLIKNISKLLIFCISMAYVLNLQVMFVILLFSMLTSILPNLTQSRLSTLRKQDLKTQKTYNKTLLDLFEGHKYVTPRTFSVFQRQHLQILNLRENEHYKFGKFRVLSDMIFSIGTNSMYLIIFLLTGYLLINGNMSLGAVSASLLYTNDLTGSISDVLSCINVLNSSKQVVSEIDEYLNKPILSDDLSLPGDVDSFKIEKLKFNRNDLELLLDSFKISNKEAVAIIGSSGSGKSTFIEIISGNLNIENGDFFNSSKLLNSEDLKKLTFTLHQREHLFDTDFINNATIFNQFPMSQISLNLMELLPREMTNRLLNYQKVDDLSGGEKQVVSIIRLLNMDYPILLMDEPFASIDKNTKEIILDYILSTNNKIIFEVTHDQRTETLSKYDKILKIENGNIQNIK